MAFEKEMVSCWERACKELGIVSDQRVWQEIMNAYRETGRYYHTTLHLGRCCVHALNAINIRREIPGMEFKKPGEAIMALFFHDFVYDTHQPDNENVRTSANVCEKYLIEMYENSGVSPDMFKISRIKRMINATDHSVEPDTEEEAIVADIDLFSMLYESTSRIEAQIRNEYRWVPDEIFRRARKDILIKMYMTPNLMKSPYGRPHEDSLKSHLMSMICWNTPHVAVAGTFDLFHEGHQVLINTALVHVERGGKLTIGLTSDEMASRKSHPVQPYQERAASITNHIRQYSRTAYAVDFEIVPLYDKMGDVATNPDYDILIASEETKAGAGEVNVVRRMNGLNPVAIYLIPLVMEGGERLSSTMLRRRMEENR